MINLTRRLFVEEVAAKKKETNTLTTTDPFHKQPVKAMNDDQIMVLIILSTP